MKAYVDGALVDLTEADLAAFDAERTLGPVPASITRCQCAREMLARELITGPEAVAMVATATPPALVETLLAALPASEAILARIDFAAGAYERGNPVLVALMTAQGAAPADIDDFFRAAAAQ